MSAAAQVAYLQALPSGILPFVWAIGAELPVLHQPEPGPDLNELQPAFYRKYTEALLRRYIRMSMEAGKVPSLIVKEMFRGSVTNYHIGRFDDVVIFLHDVDRCIARLDPEQQLLIARIAVQQFTILETAELLGLPARSVVRRYGVALDRLTRIFLYAKMLEPQKSCQGG